MPTPFPPGKNAKEAGIDVTREFVLLQADYDLPAGTTMILDKDDDTALPFFKTKNGEGKHERYSMFWHELAYAEEPAPEVKESHGTCSNELHAVELKPGELVMCAHCKIPWGKEGIEEQYTPRVGDVVRLELTVSRIDGAHLGITPNGREDFLWMPRYFFEHATLISRKQPRKVTLAEVREKFGEDVEIVSE